MTTLYDAEILEITTRRIRCTVKSKSPATATDRLKKKPMVTITPGSERVLETKRRIKVIYVRAAEEPDA